MTTFFRSTKGLRELVHCLSDQCSELSVLVISPFPVESSSSERCLLVSSLPAGLTCLCSAGRFEKFMVICQLWAFFLGAEEVERIHEG